MLPRQELGQSSFREMQEKKSQLSSLVESCCPGKTQYLAIEKECLAIKSSLDSLWYCLLQGMTSTWQAECGRRLPVPVDGQCAAWRGEVIWWRSNAGTHIHTHAYITHLCSIFSSPCHFCCQSAHTILIAHRHVEKSVPLPSVSTSPDISHIHTALYFTFRPSYVIIIVWLFNVKSVSWTSGLRHCTGQTKWMNVGQLWHHWLCRAGPVQSEANKTIVCFVEVKCQMFCLL